MVLDQYCQLLHSEWSPLYHPELMAAYITAVFTWFSSFPLSLPVFTLPASPPHSLILSSDPSSLSHTSYLAFPGLFGSLHQCCVYFLSSFPLLLSSSVHPSCYSPPFSNPLPSDPSSLFHTFYLAFPGLFSLPFHFLTVPLSSTQWFLLGANISDFATGGVWGVLFHLGLAGESDCIYHVTTVIACTHTHTHTRTHAHTFSGMFSLYYCFWIKLVCGD